MVFTVSSNKDNSGFARLIYSTNHKRLACIPRHMYRWQIEVRFRMSNEDPIGGFLLRSATGYTEIKDKIPGTYNRYDTF
jgi:hypothetical protein